MLILYNYYSWILEYLRISTSTASKTFLKYKSSNNFHSSVRSGRPKVTSAREERYIQKKVLENPFLSTREIKAEMNDCLHKEISSSTIKRILFKNNLRSYMAKKNLY